MSQSSRVNLLISELNSLERPNPKIFDEAQLTEANRSFHDKLSALKSKIKEANRAPFDVQEIKPLLSPHQPTPPDSGLKSPMKKHVNRQEFGQRTPQRRESAQIYRLPRLPREAIRLQELNKAPKGRLLMTLKQDSILKVNEWLKQNNKHFRTSRERRNTRPLRPKANKWMYNAREKSTSCSASMEESDYYDMHSIEEVDLTEKA